MEVTHPSKLYQFLLFFKTKQHVTVFDSVMFVAEGFELKCSSSLKRLHTLSMYDGCLRLFSIQRFPINLSIGVGLPDGDEYGVRFAIVDNCLGLCRAVQRPRSDRFERVNFAEINYLRTNIFR